MRGMRSRARTAVQTPRVAGVSTDLSPPAAGCPAPALPPDQSGADPGREFLAVARDLVPRDDRLHPRGRPLPNRAVHARFPGAKPHGSVLPDTGHQEGQSVSSRVSLKLALQRECLAVADRSEPGGSAPGDPASPLSPAPGPGPPPLLPEDTRVVFRSFPVSTCQSAGNSGFFPGPAFRSLTGSRSALKLLGERSAARVVLRSGILPPGSPDVNPGFPGRLPREECNRRG